MAKSPSKKKIASTTFLKAKRKIASGQFADKTSRIPSSKFAKAKNTDSQIPATDAPLERPTDEQSRQDALAILKGRAEAMRPVDKKPKK